MYIESLLQSILVYQPTQHFAKINSSEVKITSSMLHCMREATSGVYGLVIVCLPVKDMVVRQTVLELCHFLKTHPLTKDTPIVVSIDSLHRTVAMKLADAGVGFMEVHNSEAPIDPESLNHLVHLQAPSLQMNRILGKLCPWIHYQAIDDHCELTTCQAYGNRMVLGGKRLHEVCETDDHIYCDCFLCPRLDE